MIQTLFRKKMQEFIEFIEEYVHVEEQVDVNNDNVIHTFYRKHNTLQKTNENFRLLEYKRKKYIEKKRNASNSKSKSPPKNGHCDYDRDNATPQREKLNSVYETIDDDTSTQVLSQNLADNIRKGLSKGSAHNTVSNLDNLILRATNGNKATMKRGSTRQTS